MEGSGQGGAQEATATEEGTSTETQPAASQPAAGDGGAPVNEQGVQVPLATFKQSEKRVRELQAELDKRDREALSEEERVKADLVTAQREASESRALYRTAIAEAAAAHLGAARPEHVAQLISPQITDELDADGIRALVGEARESEAFSYLFGKQAPGSPPVGGGTPGTESGSQTKDIATLKSGVAKSLGLG